MTAGPVLSTVLFCCDDLYYAAHDPDQWHTTMNTTPLSFGPTLRRNRFWITRPTNSTYHFFRLLRRHRQNAELLVESKQLQQMAMTY